MCLICDGATYEEFITHMARIVAEQGWAIQGVERDRDRPPWAYTVGLTEYGLPELVATGLRLPRAAELLNGVAAHALHARAPMRGEQVPLVGGPLVEFVELPHPDAHLHTAVQMYGSDIRALQVVWADDHGHWPWHGGFAASAVASRCSGRGPHRECTTSSSARTVRAVPPGRGACRPVGLPCFGGRLPAW